MVVPSLTPTQDNVTLNLSKITLSIGMLLLEDLSLVTLHCVTG